VSADRASVTSYEEGQGTVKRIGDLTGPEVLITVGGILAVFGAFMSWATVTNGLVTYSVAGMDVQGGYAVLALILGVVTAIPSSWLPWPTAGPYVDVIAGVALIGVAIYEGANLYPTGGATSLSVGSGLWMVGIGGCLAVLGSVSRGQAATGS
jgi:hypothetical protein